MSIQSIDRACDIIELLSHTPRGMILSDMAHALSLPVSTVYRISADLVKKGYVDKSKDMNIYKIGLNFIDLSSLFLTNLELKTEAHPYLMELSRQVGFPVFLATMLDHEVCYIDRIAPLDADKAYSIVGQKRSLFTTALGKALIMDFSDEDVSALIKERGITRYTPYSITDPEDFKEELKKCRERGWSTDNQEDRLDFQCVGVPVYDFRKNIVASISTSWGKKHFSRMDIPSVALLVQSAAQKISERLGSHFNS
ncbi:IclR family transcriptional regulator [Oceanispirochaeta sp.]|jgi:IclR family KDG regulon transcriptional repressor|uniref:IclR family transcriptional regulator n=1 Tax=Oceanispirochaeta sp. TaxID=2035350 RepID=UPI002635B2CA|nr:IclR family transcriptional regulator [Oceanispirochaeta sp.]MDA3955631.1 IclR family transcriptional regulator [Oceanispirochaeta sp.]